MPNKFAHYFFIVWINKIECYIFAIKCCVNPLKGYLENGQIFDTSRKGDSEPFVFPLGQGKVIQG